MSRIVGSRGPRYGRSPSRLFVLSIHSISSIRLTESATEANHWISRPGSTAFVPRGPYSESEKTCWKFGAAHRSWRRNRAILLNLGDVMTVEAATTRRPRTVLENYSIEMTAKDIGHLEEAADVIPPGTKIP